MDSELKKIEKILQLGDGAWPGYHVKIGWAILDRSFSDNGLDFGGNGFKYFVSLDGFEVFELTKDQWHPPLITFYKNIMPSDLAALYFSVERWKANQPIALKKLSKYISKKKGIGLILSEGDERKTIAEIAKKLRSHLVMAKRKSSASRHQDVELCLTWADSRKNLYKFDPEGFTGLLEKEIGAFEASRLLSARISENMAHSYYSSIGRDVKDVSLEQCNQPNSGEWKFFDLDVGYPVDVKNARPTFNGGNRFTQHCVPRFKTTRLTSEDVKIFGVVSAYVASPKATSEGSYDTFVLGEVSKSEIQNLKQWIHRRFGSILNIEGLWDPGRIPGWLYEYPQEHYHEFEDAKVMIDEYLQKQFDQKIKREVKPWLAVLSSMDPSPYMEYFSPNVVTMVQDLRSLFAHSGLNKRSLCMYLMGVTLEGVLNPALGRNAIDTFNTVINIPAYGGDSESSVYLGLCDPLEYVASFINLMKLLPAELDRSSNDIVGFRVKHPEILQAKFKDGTVKPVIAYCGGWSLRNNVQCGFSPLVIGQHPYCRECGKLICSLCRFCNETCKLNDARQKAFACDKHAEDYEEVREIDDGGPSLYDPGYWSSIVNDY